MADTPLNPKRLSRESETTSLPNFGSSIRSKTFLFSAIRLPKHFISRGNVAMPTIISIEIKMAICAYPAPDKKEGLDRLLVFFVCSDVSFCPGANPIIL